MKQKKILILDDKHFSRICRAILERAGFIPETPDNIKHSDTLQRWQEYGLVIASYPIAEDVVSKICGTQTPVIVLSDFYNYEIREALKTFEVSRCLIKPLDYEKFLGVVGEMLQGRIMEQGGYDLA